MSQPLLARVSLPTVTRSTGSEIRSLSLTATIRASAQARRNADSLIPTDRTASRRSALPTSKANVLDPHPRPGHTRNRVFSFVSGDSEAIARILPVLQRDLLRRLRYRAIRSGLSNKKKNRGCSSVLSSGHRTGQSAMGLSAWQSKKCYSAAHPRTIEKINSFQRRSIKK